jgi:hypothetical protein
VKTGRKITKLFKDTNLKIAFKADNTTQNSLKTSPKFSEYNSTGIYKFTLGEFPIAINMA